MVSEALAGLANLAGIQAAVDGNNNIVMYAFRLPQRLGATWELLVDPTTLGLLAGGWVLLAMRAWRGGSGVGRGLRGMAALTLCVAGWLPLRAVLLMAIYMHRVLRTEYDAPLDLMDAFWSTWVHLVLLAGPVTLAMLLVPEPRPAAARDEEEALPLRRAGGVVLAAIGVAAISVAIFWNPPGQREGGRVLVDEYHSQWEDTRRPFDTTWYGHLSTYQYSSAFDYLGHFYETGRIEQPLTAKVLEGCDVLIEKVPSVAYTPQEVAAVREFVRRGGGLLLIGEHTNVFASGENLNMLARVFGFAFRYDCVFDIDNVFQQAYRPAVVPHPLLQYLPQRDGRGQLDWVVSCSIDATGSCGRAAVVSEGLDNLPVDYYANNFYPQVQNLPYMRYGAFVQVWTTTYGQGRVVGFTDSTQLSNFCVFEPGKIESADGDGRVAEPARGGGAARAAAGGRGAGTAVGAGGGARLAGRLAGDGSRGPVGLGRGSRVRQRGPRGDDAGASAETADGAGGDGPDSVGREVADGRVHRRRRGRLRDL